MRSQHFLSQEDTRTIHGIDMSILYFLDVYRANFFFCSGTGASAIYPLLACKMEPSWNFIATGEDSSGQVNIIPNPLV